MRQVLCRNRGSECLPQRRKERKVREERLTTKDTKRTKLGTMAIETFMTALENRCAGMIRAAYWHAVSVIPAKAGIHPLPPLDAGLRRHDESKKKPWGGGMVAISYSVDERKLMNASW